MAFSERVGLATAPDSGDTYAERDGDQAVNLAAAARTAVCTALGGEGIWRGAAPLVDTGTDGAKVEASASAPLVLAIADDSGYVWWFQFTSDQTITFHATSGTLSLYATIHQLAGVTPAAATGSLAAVTFQTADTPPAHSLLLGSGSVTASAYTTWTEDSAARIQPVVADPAATGNADSEIGGLTFSASPSQAECEALRDKCEELADDVRALRATLLAVTNALQARFIVSAT